MTALAQKIDLDMGQNQLLNARFQVLSAHPTSPPSAQVWYRSDLTNGTGNGQLYYRDSNGNNIPIATGNTALSNAYSTVTDGTTAMPASGADTLTVAASGAGLTVATATKTITYTLNSGLTGASKILQLTAGGKITASVGQQVWATTDLTDVGSKTGSGTAIVFSTGPTLSAPVIAGTTVAVAAGAISYNTGVLWMGDGVVGHQIVLTDGAQTLTNKTLSSPAIGDFSNATHNHTNAANGGTLTHSAITDFDPQVRTSRLDQMSSPTAAVSWNSQRLTSLADPINAQDAATKNYVDLNIQGTPVRSTANYATTGTLPAATYANGASGVGATLTGNANGALGPIDGQTVLAGDNILVRLQPSTFQNGLYVVTQVGDGTHPFILTRHTTMDQSGEMSGAIIAVEFGTIHGGSLWMLAITAPTVGTTSLPFTELNKAADLLPGTGIQFSGNTVSANFTARFAASGGQFDLASGVVTPGTYSQLTVDTYGRVTNGVELSAVSGMITRIGANNYTGRTITGTANRTTITFGDGSGGNPTIDIHASYIGQNTITTLGTVTTGTWNATVLGLAYGGAGIDASTGAGAGTARDATHLGRPGTAPTNTTNVTASAVGIPTMVKATLTGTGVATTFTVNHNLNNSTPVVQVNDSSGNEITVGVQYTDANNVALSWNTAPANASTWTVTLIG